MSGNGDPLASAIMRPLMQDWQVTPNQTFTLKTNGLLIKKQLNNLGILNHISEFSISVDAGSKQIYEDVRRPGRWETLIENLEFLHSINKSNVTCLNFAFQNKNYKDLDSFIELCRCYNFRGQVHELDNWGTWNIMKHNNVDTWTIQNGVFSDHDVLDNTHINYQAAKDMIAKNLGEKNIQFSTGLLERILQ
jgi:MoaA/NifB/PqqE/SkfB family radical SAM enzyme